jgi:hypothetical protein
LFEALARYVRSVSDFVLSGDPPLGNVRESARATRLSWAASDASASTAKGLAASRFTVAVAPNAGLIPKEAVRTPAAIAEIPNREKNFFE